MKNSLFYGIVLAAAIGFSIFILFPRVDTNGNAVLTNFESRYTGTVDSGDVSLEIQPIEVGKAQAVFMVYANTHSVDLSQFDLKQIATLEYGWKSVRPSFAPQLASHHSNGRLIFPVDRKINEFRIIITGIPLTNERVFQW